MSYRLMTIWRAFLLCSLCASCTANALDFGTFGNWDSQTRRDAANASMRAVVNRFNIYGDFNWGSDGYVDVYYNAGVPTAQSNYYGTIDFGGTWPNERVAQHELNHWLGSGTYWNWANLFTNAVWTGPKVNALIAQFDGDGSVLRQSGVHFYGYGLNYDTEVVNDSIFMRNVAIMYAMRQDMGNGNPNNPWSATSVSLTKSDDPGTSAFNWFGGGYSGTYGGWSDRYFAHKGAAYSSGNFVLRTPLDTGNPGGVTPSFTFAGDSLTINNTNGNAGGLWYQGHGTTGVVTIANLTLNGGYIRHMSGAGDLFQLAGNVTLVSNSTVDADQGSIKILSRIGGAGSLTVRGANSTILAGTNVYGGGTTIAAGTLRVASNSALGSGAVVLAGGTLSSDNNGGAAFEPTMFNAITVASGSGIAGGVGTLFHVKSNITGSAPLRASGVLNGAGLRLEGDNSGYSGAVTVAGANTRLGAPAAGSAAAAWVVNANLQTDVTGGGTFDLGSLSGSGGISGHAANTVPAVSTLRVGALNTSTTFSGRIIDNASSDAATGNADGAANNILALTKVGAGVLTLSGANTYSGATTISAGTLRLSSPSAVPQATPIASYTFAQVSGYTVVNAGSGGAAMNGVLNSNGGTGSISTSGGPAAGLGVLVLRGDGTTVDINSSVANLGSSATWTVSAWIKTTQAGATILNKGDGANWSSGFSTFYLGDGSDTGSGGVPDAVRWGGGWLAGSSAVNDGRWHLLTYTNSAGAKSVYVDGVAEILGQSQFLNTDTGSKIRIGFSPAGETDGNVVPTASLSGIGLYNTALSAAQVAAIYRNTLGLGGSPLPAGTDVTIAAGATLDVNGMTQTVGSLNGSAGSAVTLGAGQLTVALLSDSQFHGAISGTGSLTKDGPGSLTLSGSNAYTGATTVNAGTLRVSGSIAGSSKVVVNNGGTFEAGAESQTLQSAAVAGGTLRIAPTAGGPAKVLTIGDGTHTFADPGTAALAIAGGTVDVSNNALVVRFAPGSDAAAAATIRGYIVSARNSAAADWRGAGITADAAIADPGSRSVGYALSSQLLGPAGGDFMGATVDGDSVVVRATLAGDATLDGRVDFNDLVKLAQNYNTSDSAVDWLRGDFDYNGQIDFNDLVKLAQNYNAALLAQAIPGASADFSADVASAFANVPEPGAALGALGLAAMLVARRRRK